MDIYSLSRNFWDWSFENPDKIRPNHIAMYFFAVEHCNRLGWKSKFGFPTTMVMDAIGVKSYNTFIKTLNELVEYGFIEMIEKSKNQYSSNIIALSKNDKALDKALDKAMIKHSTKQSESNDSIDIPIYKSTGLPKIEDIEITEEENPRVIEATKKISEFFDLSEVNQPKHFITIGNFVRYIHSKGQIQLLADQFTAYKAIKSLNPKFRHNWTNYIGSPEDSYQNGMWNLKNWVAELEILKSSEKPKANRDTKDLGALRKSTLEKIHS